jgi:hypothetical protein
MLVLVPAARADQILTEETILFTGTESQTLSLGDPGAGTVTVVLTDLAWPTKAASLSFSMTTASTLLLPLTSNPDSFSVSSVEALYLHIAGDANSLAIPGLPSFGLFSLQVDFTPAAPPVPLPASVWLLASALAGLLGVHVLRSRAVRAVPAPLAH